MFRYLVAYVSPILFGYMDPEGLGQDSGRVLCL